MIQSSSQNQPIQQDSAGNVQYPTVVFVIEMIDNIVVIFFTVEFLVRLLVCPNKMRYNTDPLNNTNINIFRFVKDTMNLIDLVAICPFYISLILEGLEDFAIIGKTGKIIRLVRTLSIMRKLQCFLEQGNAPQKQRRDILIMKNIKPLPPRFG